MIETNVEKCNIYHDDGGFSLVELIICVAILAIAIIPLYQSMSLSARTNAKAQSIQNATSLGESVMEEIKSSSIYDIQAKYNDLTDVDDPETGKKKPNVTVLPKTDTEYFGAAPPASDEEKQALFLAEANEAKSTFGNIPADGDKGIENAQLLTGKIDPADDPPKPYYVLYKHKAVSTQGEEFDVVATLRTSSYMETENNTASDANTKKLPRIEEIDTLSQAVISSKEFGKYDKAALDFFRQNGGGYDGTKSINTKSIIIEKTDKALLYDTIYVKCRVVYTDNTGSSYTRELFSGTFSAPDDWDNSTPIASNIYLFYKDNSSIPTETITINDSTSKATHKVYFVMQSDTPGEALIIDGKGIKIEYHGKTLDKSNDLNHDGNIIDGDYELITNLQHKNEAGDSVKGHIYNEEAGIRIYDLTVCLFKVKDDGSLGEFVTSIESTKESSDSNKK